jgi:cytochrome c
MAKHLFFGLLINLILHLLIIPSYAQGNNPPAIKIISPLDKSTVELNSSIQYRIKVSDKEDGESEFDEIASNEVFLEVRYVQDAVKKSVSAISTVDPNGLTVMKKSNCFNCHAFNGKLIAPSFYEIAKRYAVTDSNRELLAKRIREGSGGVWGTASMPSHVEIKYIEATEIINWIFKNALDPNLNYYTGLEGTVKIKTAGNNQKGAFVLSATYSDHGTKKIPLENLSTRDVIVVYIK